MNNRLKKLLAPAVFATSLLLGGCVTPDLYDWGTYDSDLYNLYLDGDADGNLRTSLTEHVAKVESEGGTVAPGLFAELGTLHLLAQDYEAAAKFYTKEADAWPESKVLMDKLLKAVKRQQAQGVSTQPIVRLPS